ncbi:MAG: histidine phosphatase family protein [Candidatus Eremiobacteraeota bacterium]|nr:histidine phosphatase family protein [Candidatus Eremiobacteraeota bacterium]
MRIYLVRHGETSYNKEGKMQGRIDIPLDKEGEAQAEALGAYFKDEMVKNDGNFSAVYASPLTRAAQTAAPVAQALNLPVKKDGGLTELDMGEWEGKTRNEIASWKDAQGVPLFQKCFTDPLHNPMPGGETLPSMERRVTASLNEIIRNSLPTESVVCITHGGAIAIALCHVLGKSLQEVPRNMVQNASVTVIEADQDLDHGMLLIRDNISHLKTPQGSPPKRA